MTDERDRYVPKHPTPAKGVPEFSPEEVTGQYEGEELRVMRGHRPNEKRLGRLEAFKDIATAEFADIKVSLADLRGDQKAQNVTLSNIEKHLSENRHRERVSFEAHVDLETAEKIDVIDARKAKRQLWLKVAGIFASGGVVFELLHRIGVL